MGGEVPLATIRVRLDRSPVWAKVGIRRLNSTLDDRRTEGTELKLKPRIITKS